MTVVEQAQEDRLSSIASLRERRLLAPARGLAKQVLVGVDVLRSRRDPELREWLPVCRGARAGHVVRPSKAIRSSREEAADFVARSVFSAGDRVLDIGAGNGRQAIGLLELGASQYVGLEVVRDSVTFASQAFASYDKAHFDWLDVVNDMYNPDGSVPADQVRFPYDDGCFDFVVAGSLFTHLEVGAVAARYVAETARVLAPDGSAFLSWFRNPPNDLSSSAVRTVYAEADVLGWLASAGLRVEQSVGGTTTGWHDQWKLYVRKAGAPGQGDTPGPA